MSSEFFDTNSDKTLYKLRPTPAPPSTTTSTTTHHHYHYHQSGPHKSSAAASSQENLAAERFFNDSSAYLRPGIDLIPYKLDSSSSCPDTSCESLSSNLSLDSSPSWSTNASLWSQLKRKMRSNLSKFSFMFTFCFTWIAIFFLYQSGLLFANETTFFKSIPPLFPDNAYEIPLQSSNNPSLASAFILKNPLMTPVDSCHKNLVDIYDGSLTYLHHAIEFNQHVFIYLYAHWDARSVFFSSLVKQLACKYSSPDNQILFLTVNCFNPNGECRKYFNLVKYPQVVFQVRNSGIFSYKGPMKLNYVSEFIEHLRAPVKRIDSIDELVDFTIDNQVVAIANLNLNIPQENDLYKTFYLSAMKAFIQNSENPIKYGIVLNQTVWQQIISNFQEPALRNCHQFSRTDSNSTNATIDDSLENRIMIFDLFGFKKTFKNVNKTTVDSLTAWSQNNFKKVLDWSFPDRDGQLVKHRSAGRSNMLVFTERGDKLEDLFKYLIVEDMLVSSKNRGDQSCKFHSRVIDKLRHRLGEVLGDQEPLLVKDEECWSPPSSSLASKHLDGLDQACRKNWRASYRPFNGSVHVDLLDKALYLNYAKSLLHESKHSSGQDDGKFPIKNETEPVVILVDYEHENLHLLEKTPDYQNLKEFIDLNSKHNLNNRHIRVKQITNQSSQIEEINTAQMTSIFSKEASAELYHEKDLLIFYFNNWCGFCKTASFMLNDLVFRYLKNCPSFKLVEIDTDSNDLPWNLHAQHLPALLFKPARSSETTFFSYDQRFTIKDLLGFILHSAGDADTLKCYLNENVVKARNESRTRLQGVVDKRITTLGRKVDHYREKLEQLQTEMKLIGQDNGNAFDEYGNLTINKVYTSLATQLYFHNKHLNLIKDFKSLFG